MSGILDPAEMVNVQVKFMPKEEVSLKAMWLCENSLNLFKLYSAHASMSLKRTFVCAVMVFPVLLLHASAKRPGGQVSRSH